MSEKRKLSIADVKVFRDAFKSGDFSDVVRVMEETEWKTATMTYDELAEVMKKAPE